MPSANTMEVAPIRDLVLKYIQPNMETIDPFARNCKIAKWRNDLNPDTNAEYHLDALDFLRMCQSKVFADLVLFDPPYSMNQLQVAYQGVGRSMGVEDTARPNRWSQEREVLRHLVRIGGVVISFGWNTSGMGFGRGFEPVEFLCVCHGPGHNDTLITVERKVVYQASLFGAQNMDLAQQPITPGMGAL